MPNSHVASFKDIAGSASLWKNLSKEKQQELLKKYNTPAGMQYLRLRYGLMDERDSFGGMPVGSIGQPMFNATKYQALYSTMAGMSGGAQRNLVDAAIQQWVNTDKVPYSALASQYGHFLYTGNNISDNKPLEEDQIKFLQDVAGLKSADIAKLNLDQIETIKAKYGQMQHLFRGNFANIGQIIGQYGRKEDGSVVSFQDIMATGGDKAKLQELGLSIANAEALSNA